MTNEPTSSATIANVIRNVLRNESWLPLAVRASWMAAAPLTTSTSGLAIAVCSSDASSVCETPGAATTLMAS
jgi:hypothetical protein